MRVSVVLLFHCSAFGLLLHCSIVPLRPPIHRGAQLAIYRLIVPCLPERIYNLWLNCSAMRRKTSNYQINNLLTMSVL